MLWGANAGRKRAYREAGAEDFGDFGKYMAEKQRKLRVQFQAEADASTKDTSNPVAATLHAETSNSGILDNSAVSVSMTKLFEGISIFVDGFTIPSHQELRMLMIKYGGSFENYFRRDSVTHIICSTLPDSKIKDIRSFSRGLPVVKPSWIVDSINHGRVLPFSSYQLERVVHDDPNQSTIARFLASRGDYLSTHLPLADTPNLRITETSYQQESKTSLALATCRKEQSDSLELASSTSKPSGSSYVVGESTFEAAKKVSKSPEGSNSAAVCDDSVAGSTCAHSTLGDTNFVRNFFKNSRLHFIGTWRNRYQNRFGHSDSNGDSPFHEDCPLSMENPAVRSIMHVDMDCFFVSVVVRNRPALNGKPVAVCHSSKAHGTAEISSSNYAAREFGVKSGMFIRDAMSLCPDLEIVPYDFEGYEQVADQLYDILHKHCRKVQAISCDEAYLDVCGMQDPMFLASSIREEIFNVTRCTASIGIGGNLLLARMATRKAKPDGLYQILSTQVEDFLSDLPVSDLPGVGWSLLERLHGHAVYNCSQLRALSKDYLQKEYGFKTGNMLWCYVRGIDQRQLQNFQERKSIGAEVNWGVRFKSLIDAQHFLSRLCEEVAERLQSAALCGRTFTLKIKKRRSGAEEPEKFMGCGICDNLSKSITVSYPTNAVDVLFRISKQILASFHLDVCEIRGVGLQVTKLDSIPKSTATKANIVKGQQEGKVFESWLDASSRDAHCEEAAPIKASYVSINEKGANRRINNTKDSSVNVITWGLSKAPLSKAKGMQSLGKVLKGPFSARRPTNQDKNRGKQKQAGAYTLPNVSELDHSVLACLPPEIMAEINEVYAGAIALCMSGPAGAHTSCAEKCLAKVETSEVQQRATVANRLAESENNDNGSMMDLGCVEMRTMTCDAKESVSLSLSQIDVAVLEELPAEMHQEILMSLPKHRPIAAKEESKSENCRVDVVGQPGGSGNGSEDAFPCELLAEQFLEGDSSQNLSVILLEYTRSCSTPSEIRSSGLRSAAFQQWLEFLKQYLKVKAACNLEEVFMVARALKRLGALHEFWHQICDLIVPFVQALSSEHYGGSLLL